MIKFFLAITIALTFSGCIVGTLVSAPFKAVGMITPGATGIGASVVGTAIDAAIPF